MFYLDLFRTLGDHDARYALVKMAAGREQDRADLEHLERIMGRDP